MYGPFLKAKSVLEKIEKAGFEAYFVGGSVRNFLIDIPIEDVDIATSATPYELKEIFPKTFDVGIEHGTIIVIHNQIPYEITTFRTEGEYEDFRHPKEVTFVRSLHEDLKRRDFTMNAIAMSKEGKIIDPFDGQKDIKRKLIRTVGNPSERFHEDALRMMRAVRFVSQLSFQLEEETIRAIQNDVQLLDFIAVERKFTEFQKLLKGENRHQALNALVNLGLHHYLPRLSKYGKEIVQAAQIMGSRSLTVDEAWAILLLFIERENPKDFLKSWRMSMNQLKTIESIMETYHERKRNGWSKKLIFQKGIDISKQAEHVFALIHQCSEEIGLLEVEQIYESLPIKDRSELAVNGHDLMEWMQMKSGVWIKDLLEKIEDAVLHNKVMNSKEAIKEWIQN